MKIHYYQNAEKELTVAVACSDEKYPHGIDAGIAEMLVEHGFAERSKMQVPKRLKAFATPGEHDTYDAEVGYKVARDKVLVKYYARLEKAHEHYLAGLKRYVDSVAGLAIVDAKHCASAEERLKTY